MLTQKDFVALADSMRSLPWTADQLQCIMEWCWQMNPRFKATRWVDYLEGRCTSHGRRVSEAD